MAGTKVVRVYRPVGSGRRARTYLSTGDVPGGRVGDEVTRSPEYPAIGGVVRGLLFFYE